MLRHEAPLRFHVGPAGWSYRDWEGRVYPRSCPRGFDRLDWMASLFDLIEINVSFYRVPPHRVAQGWVQRLRDHGAFLFSAKLPRELTHQRGEGSLTTVRPFREFLRPLEEADRLAVVLAQFPWSFRADPTHLEHLCRLREALAPVPMVTELRHGSWTTGNWMGRLEEEGLEVASIDQPVIGDSIGPELRPRPHTYLRLHGRNTQAWFDANAGRDARYDYEYDANELQPWVDGLRRLPATTKAVYVVTNNHFEGQAVVNALELKAMLGAAEVVIPAPLLERHPDLEQRIARQGAATRLLDLDRSEGPRSHRSAGQPELFDDL